MKDLPNLPDFALQLSEEKAKAIKNALTRISTEYSHFETSLMRSLQLYDSLIEQGFQPHHNEHRIVGSGYTFVYTKSDKVLKAEQQKAINAIEAEFLEKENQLKSEFIEELLGKELAERQDAKLKEMEKEKALLKEKLLSTLFK